MSSALYRRINELVEEVRSLKRAIVRKDALLEAACVHNRNIVEENTRLANENSSLKHAEYLRTLPQKPSRQAPAQHPTLACAGTVAE